MTQRVLSHDVVTGLSRWSFPTRGAHGARICWSESLTKFRQKCTIFRVFTKNRHPFPSHVNFSKPFYHKAL